MWAMDNHQIFLTLLNYQGLCTQTFGIRLDIYRVA